MFAFCFRKIDSHIFVFVFFILTTCLLSEYVEPGSFKYILLFVSYLNSSSKELLSYQKFLQLSQEYQPVLALGIIDKSSHLKEGFLWASAVLIALCLDCSSC